eukprot:gene18014-biopygen13061
MEPIVMKQRAEALATLLTTERHYIHTGTPPIHDHDVPHRHVDVGTDGPAGSDPVRDSSALTTWNQLLTRVTPATRGRQDCFWADPRFLVFEFMADVILRKQQVHMICAFMDRLQPVGKRPGRSSVWQMLMGAGKTTIVTPILCLLQADGSKLITSVVPGALL